ncbi:hypothetical protein BGX23_012073 [Mortierella sp. AD031]|nr:hypothetical protein BGX23_012073 [Mortierella sp. AD031]
MAKDTSTSSSNRFSFNGSNNNTNNHNNGALPSYSYPGSRDRSPDLESAYSTGSSSNNNSSNNRTIKKTRTPSRTPSPPLSTDRSAAATSIPFAPFLKRRLSKKPCLLLGVLAVGLLLPIWIFTTGVITLDSFNDVVRYLPGYHHFANNLLYLVMFLLFVSFTILATLPILPIFILGLPFHLLIFSIFNRLMSDWLWWCIGCYTVLFIAPVGSIILARIKAAVGQQYDGGRRELLIRHKPTSSSHVRYSPLYPNNDNAVNNSNINNNIVINNLTGAVGKEDQDSDLVFDSFSPQQYSSPRGGLTAIIGRRIEYGVHLFSKSNRTSIRWRLLLAMVFWLSYVIPVTLRNEARDFDPARAVPSFDIQHPEWLCSANDDLMMDNNESGFQGEPRQSSFEAYWQEYLEFHREMVIPESQGGIPDSDKRFLIFQPSDDGLGNRLQALLSSVVMAMVTRRAIILDWLAMPQCNANFTDLFQQPEGLAWDLNTTLPYHKDMPEYKTKPEIWYPYCRNCALRSPITPESTWSNLLCNANLGIDSSTPIVQIFSTQWFLPVLQHNPHWKRELCHMFPQGGKNAFQVLSQKLLKPSGVVQAKIDSVMDRIPKDVTLIGLQVRRTENNAVGQGIEDAFLSCAADVVQEEERKSAGFASIDRRPGSSGSVEPHLVQTGQYLDDNTPSTGATGSKKSGRFAYYLATDYRPTRAHFQEVLGEELYVLDNTFHITKPPGVQSAVAEMFLLAQADRIISSPYSTFGYFAHGYANVQPNIVKRDGTCIKRRSTQPCFQYWFGFANGGAKCNIRSTIEMSEDYDCWL